MRLLSLSATYIVLQGLTLTVCAAPVSYSLDDVRARNIINMDNHTNVDGLQTRGYEDRRSIKDKIPNVDETVDSTPLSNSSSNASVSASPTMRRSLSLEDRSIKEKITHAVKALTGHSSSSSASSAPTSDPSSDASLSTTPPEKRSRGERRSIFGEITHVVESVAGHTSNSGTSSSTPSKSEQPAASASASASAAPPARRFTFDQEERRTIKENIHNTPEALEGHRSSSEGSSSSSADPSQDTSASTVPLTRRMLYRRKQLAVVVTVSNGEALTAFVSESQIHVREAIHEVLEAASKPLELGIGSNWRLDWENVPSTKADAKSRIEFTITGPPKCGGTCTAWIEDSKHAIQDHSGKVIYP
ncbi:hypothetical protein J3R30DRAFT_1239503 [Lentinula aciculospora]|uniref:Uncharacterized protein n=1 Tax=Lentinula aciculospora TaxID=153920 RepID=A0A9W8ZYS4_9AGAR|nr:hypothetical protein J3R30DRAFT_1239503 [Lentinula aciculospora]